MKKINNKKGFTLIEMVVVISILAVMGTVGIMATGGMIKKAQIKDYTQVAETIAKTVNEIGEREKKKETPYTDIKTKMEIPNVCSEANIDAAKYEIVVTLDLLDEDGIVITGAATPVTTAKAKKVTVCKKGKPEVAGVYGE
ncbi:MAG: type II secretion system protein [Oscillospiraceae bacterium]